MKKIYLLATLPLILSGCSKPININDYDFNYFEEFKEMIDSLVYFEFDKDNSINPKLDDEYRYKFYGGTTLNLNSSHHHNEYTLEYLNLLPDSLFYPTLFRKNDPNISSLWISIDSDQFLDTESYKLNQGPIRRFAISRGTVDPDHTNPSNPLISLSVDVQSLHYQEADEDCRYFMTTYTMDSSLKYSNELIELDYTISINMGFKNTVKIGGHFHHNNYCYKFRSFRTAK